MRVLHVGLETTRFRPGGLNRYLEQLVAAERDGGLDAAAVVLGDDVDLPEGIHVAGPAGCGMLRGALAVDRAVRRADRPDLADLHFAGTSALAATLGALRRVPVVVHFQGPWADESRHAGSSRLNAALKRQVERRVYRRARRVVVLTSAFAELVQRRYGVAPWLVDVVHPGVDLARFAPGDRDTARAQLGAPQGRVVLAVRRLVPRMGLEVLLEAWASLRPGPGDALVIVGDGPCAPQLRRSARELGVDASVRLLGRVDDEALVAWYRAADVTVVPSLALEGFGLVVLESLACATPVVGTDAGGLAEALDAAGAGPGVPAGDVGALAAALARALGEPRTPERDHARRAAAASCSWAAVAARHADVYAQALREERPLRVVALDHTAVLSGGELALARAVGGLGGAADVHVVLGEDGPLRARLERAGASVEVLALTEDVRGLARGAVRPTRLGPRRLLATAGYVVRLARRLRELRPDVVHANSLKSLLYGGAAARLAGVPCVWHVRDLVVPPSLPRPASRLVRASARVLPSLVVANSATTLAAVGVEGRVVPSPLDPSIRPVAREGAGELRVTVLGRLAPWKGQHLAIGAFADAFPQAGATLRVVGAPLFGEDDYAATLAPLAEQLGVADRVTLAGFVEDVAGVLGTTDVLVHASVEPEPFGQVVLEALGAGCAVVVPDAGGPAEVVTDGVDGLAYRLGDRASLAAALRRLADDPGLRARLGAAGVATAADYTPEALAPRLLDAWAQASGRDVGREGASRG